MTMHILVDMDEMTFYSLEELNAVLWEKMEQENRENFQGLSYSRVSVKSVPAKELPDTNQGIRRENQYMSATGASPRNVSTASPMAYWNASSVIQEQVE